MSISSELLYTLSIDTHLSGAAEHLDIGESTNFEPFLYVRRGAGGTMGRLRGGDGCG